MVATTGTRTTERITLPRRRLSSPNRSAAAATTSRPTWAARRASSRGSKSCASASRRRKIGDERGDGVRGTLRLGEAGEEQPELEEEIQRQAHERLVERIRGRRDEGSDHERDQEHVPAALREPLPVQDADAHER